MQASTRQDVRPARTRQGGGGGKGGQMGRVDRKKGNSGTDAADAGMRGTAPKQKWPKGRVLRQGRGVARPRQLLLNAPSRCAGGESYEC